MALSCPRQVLSVCYICPLPILFFAFAFSLTPALFLTQQTHLALLLLIFFIYWSMRNAQYIYNCKYVCSSVHMLLGSIGYIRVPLVVSVSTSLPQSGAGKFFFTHTHTHIHHHHTVFYRSYHLSYWYLCAMSVKCVWFMLQCIPASKTTNMVLFSLCFLLNKKREKNPNCKQMGKSNV